MKVEYLGGSFEGKLSLIKGEIYECLGEEKGWLRVIDETGEDYLFPKREFKIIEEKEDEEE